MIKTLQAIEEYRKSNCSTGYLDLKLEMINTLSWKMHNLQIWNLQNLTEYQQKRYQPNIELYHLSIY